MSRKEDIKNEYGKLCVAAGELQYRIKMQERELHELNTKIEDLNQEFSSILKAEAEAKPAEPVEAPKAEVVNG